MDWMRATDWESQEWHVVQDTVGATSITTPCSLGGMTVSNQGDVLYIYTMLFLSTWEQKSRTSSLLNLSTLTPINMHFSVLATLATLGSGALSALTGVQVVQNIDTLTTKSRVLIEPTKHLSTINAPLLLIGQGPWPVNLDHPFHSLGHQRRHMQKGH